LPGDANAQPTAAQQNPQMGQQPVQPAMGLSPAATPTAPSRQQVAGKTAPKGAAAGHKDAKPKNAAAHGASSRAGKAKTARQKADQTRIDRARVEKQRRRPAGNSTPLNTARHRAPAVQPAQPAMEGQ
jgi:hypothetical protein